MNCSKCKSERENKNQSYCKKCHAEYMRKWRLSNPLSKEQKQRDICRSYAGVYKRRKKLTPQPCEICKSEVVEMHHDDYSKPLKVRWLCSIHHKEYHST